MFELDLDLHGGMIVVDERERRGGGFDSCKVEVGGKAREEENV